MVLLGSVLVPVGGVFLAHFVRVAKAGGCRSRSTPPIGCPAFNPSGIAAWAAGFIVYKLAAPIGATLPALATSMIVYLPSRLSPSQRDAVVTQSSH